MKYGREFYKMTGSGNDFVFFDARDTPAGELATATRIQALSARGTGIGADGVVFLERSTAADFQIAYFNRDGSRGELCGNASLCTTRLAVELGAASPDGMAFGTDAGLIRARIVAGLPEIDLQPVTAVEPELPLSRQPCERRLGFAMAGVPHVVILHDDVARADVDGRGRELRWNAAFPQGANVNFVEPDRENRFIVRTYERGVEAETLACGTGAVSSAVLLSTWGLTTGPDVELVTRSGRSVYVRLAAAQRAGAPSLRGEGRLVYRGRLAEV